MRLYTLSRRDFLWTTLAFVFVFLAIIFIGLAGPSIIQSNMVNSSYFTPPYSIETGPYKFISPTLSSFNQEMWLLSYVKIIKPDKTATYGRKLNISVVMFPIDRDGSGSSGVQTYNRERSLVCNGMYDTSANEEWCEPFVIMHIGYIQYPKFKLQVKFDGLQIAAYPVQDVKFEFKTYNPNFSEFELWFRFSFVVITFFIMGVFAHVLRKYHLRNWTLEQKWMAIILPALMLSNDPIFPLKFLYDSWIPGIFDTLFEVTFVCILLMFWLCVYDGIRTTSRRFVVFYLPKLLLCGLFWVAAVTLGSWQNYTELYDPTYNYKLDMEHFMGMKVFFYLLIAIYFIYISYLFITSYGEIKSKPFFTIRIRFLTALNIFLIIFCVAFAIIQFGGKILQDNFVATLAVSYKNSAEFVCFYGLFNLYVYALAFVYSPSTEEAIDGETANILPASSSVDVIQSSEPIQDSPC